jgi:GNAT superfamily N-acetyltransferase
MRAIEFLIETINPECFNPAFNDTQIFDDLTYRASVEQDQNNKKYFVVKVVDDNFERVGLVKFKPLRNTNGDYWLESLITAIHPEYRGKGIARNVYAYVKMLGNTIKPSSDQTEQGRNMWDAWRKSGDAEHLMK